jgi:hypothetical protein
MVISTSIEYTWTRRNKGVPPMASRARIDLDGVTLRDPESHGSAIAIFCRRTSYGLQLLIPESADFLVPWESIENAHIDMVAGAIRITFAPEYRATNHWLRGASTLEGQWLDRHVIAE